MQARSQWKTRGAIWAGRLAGGVCGVGWGFNQGKHLVNKQLLDSVCVCVWFHALFLFRRDEAPFLFDYHPSLSENWGPL